MDTLQLTQSRRERRCRGLAVAVATALLFLPMSPVPSPGQESEKGAVSTHEHLMKAQGELQIALHYAELAITPHQPGVGWHKAQTQRALNVLVGAESPDFSKDVENPGDGHGVMRHLKDAHEAMKGCRPVTTCDAIESSLEYLEP